MSANQIGWLLALLGVAVFIAIVGTIIDRRRRK
jgi:hypothetical protein